MLSRVAADVVMGIHFTFLVFLAGGSLLAWRWPRVVAVHLPSVVWGLVSVTVGLACPLTPLEQQLRRSAGDQGYAGGFVDHYIEGVIYPEQYTPLLRGLIATAVVVGYVGLLRRSPRCASGGAPTWRRGLVTLLAGGPPKRLSAKPAKRLLAIITPRDEVGGWAGGWRLRSRPSSSPSTPRSPRPTPRSLICRGPSRGHPT